MCKSSQPMLMHSDYNIHSKTLSKFSITQKTANPSMHILHPSIKSFSSLYNAVLVRSLSSPASQHSGPRTIAVYTFPLISWHKEGCSCSCWNSFQALDVLSTTAASKQPLTVWQWHSKSLLESVTNQHSTNHNSHSARPQNLEQYIATLHTIIILYTCI